MNENREKRTMTSKQQEANLSVEELGKTFKGISKRINQRKKEIEGEDETKVKAEEKENKKIKNKPTKTKTTKTKTTVTEMKEMQPNKSNNGENKGKQSSISGRIANPYKERVARKSNNMNERHQQKNEEKQQRKKHQETKQKKLKYKSACEMFDELSDGSDESINVLNKIHIPKLDRKEIGAKVHNLGPAKYAKFPNENSHKADIVKVEKTLDVSNVLGEPNILEASKELAQKEMIIDPTARLVKVDEGKYVKGTAIEADELNEENWRDYVFILKKNRHAVRVVTYVMTTMPTFTKYLYTWFAQDKTHSIKVTKFLHLRTTDVLWFKFTCQATVNIESFKEYLRKRTLKGIHFNVYERRVFIVTIAGNEFWERALVLETVDKDAMRVKTLMLLQDNCYMSHNYKNIVPVPLRMEPDTNESRFFWEHRNYMKARESVVLQINDEKNYASLIKNIMKTPVTNKSGKKELECIVSDIYPGYAIFSTYRRLTDHLEDDIESWVKILELDAEIVYTTQKMVRDMVFQGFEKVKLLIDGASTLDYVPLISKPRQGTNGIGTNATYELVAKENEEKKSTTKKVGKKKIESRIKEATEEDDEESLKTPVAATKNKQDEPVEEIVLNNDDESDEEITTDSDILEEMEEEIEKEKVNMINLYSNENTAKNLHEEFEQQNHNEEEEEDDLWSKDETKSYIDEEEENDKEEDQDYEQVENYYESNEDPYNHEEEEESAQGGEEKTNQENEQYYHVSKEEFMGETRVMVQGMMTENNEKIYSHINTKHDELKTQTEGMIKELKGKFSIMENIKGQIAKVTKQHSETTKELQRLNTVEKTVDQLKTTTEKLQKDTTIGFLETKKENKKLMEDLEDHMDERQSIFERMHIRNMRDMEERADKNRNKNTKQMENMMMEQFAAIRESMGAKADYGKTKEMRNKVSQDESYSASHISDTDSLEERFKKAQKRSRRESDNHAYIRGTGSDDEQGPINEIKLSRNAERSFNFDENSLTSSLGFSIQEPIFTTNETTKEGKKQEKKSTPKSSTKKQKKKETKKAVTPKQKTKGNNDDERPANKRTPSKEKQKERKRKQAKSPTVDETPLTKNTTSNKKTGTPRTQAKLDFATQKKKKSKEPTKVQPSRIAKRQRKDE